MNDKLEKAKLLLLHHNFHKLTKEQMNTVYLGLRNLGVTEEEISSIVKLKYVNNKLYHTTSLNGLYNILNSDYLRSRNKSNAEVGYSPKDHKESGDWIYFSFQSKLPPPGKMSVQLVFSSDLLTDRSDYFLNREWSYGKTNNSLPPDKLDEFLKNLTPVSEIIFENDIPLIPYLLEINIVQLPTDILSKIPEAYKPQTVNFNKIPEKYKNLIKIIEKLM